MHRMNSSHLDLCSACHAHIETRAHACKCTHPDYNAWRNSLLRSIVTQCQTLNVDMELAHLLITGLEAGWLGTDVDIATFSLLLHRLIVDQTNIGWTNIMNGRWSTEWEKIQKERSELDPTVQFYPWTAKIINHIWEQWFASWTIQNSCNHDKEQIEKLLLKKDYSWKELDRHYTCKQKVSCVDRDLFRDTVEIHKQQSLSEIEAWIMVFAPTIKMSYKEMKQQNGTDIRNHFNPRQAIIPNLEFIPVPDAHTDTDSDNQPHE